MSERYALYYAPASGSELDRFGSGWLGRDAASGAALPMPEVAGITAERMRELTVEPRRYGFHATLKPPFRLAAGTDPDGLLAAVAEFAAGTAPVPLPALAPACLGGFLALIPSTPCPALPALAAACVTRLDHFRAPPGAEELARRLAAGLSPRQREHLQRWGYPYVLDEFRFHMTLTGRLEDVAERQALQAALTGRWQAAKIPAPVLDHLCLFHQPLAGADFQVIRRFFLAGEVRERPDPDSGWDAD